MTVVEGSGARYARVKCPQLPELTLTNIGGKRHYNTPDGQFISITTLLSTNVPDSITEWRKSVGDDVANYVMRTAASRGTKVHKLVELHLSNEPPADMTDYGVLPMGLFKLMQPALERIDNIRMLEQRVYSAELGIAGTADAICEFDSTPSICDFKTASRIRDRESITNYFLQCAFYATAWEEQTGEEIGQLVIIMASDDGHLEVFKEAKSSHMDKLMQLVKEYRDALPTV